MKKIFRPDDLSSDEVAEVREDINRLMQELGKSIRVETTARQPNEQSDTYLAEFRSAAVRSFFPPRINLNFDEHRHKQRGVSIYISIEPSALGQLAELITLTASLPAEEKEET